MECRDEADEAADGTPQSVFGAELQDHTLLAIDGAGRLLELVGFFEQHCDLDLLSVLGGPAPAPPAVRQGGRPGNNHRLDLFPRAPVRSGAQAAPDRDSARALGI